MPITTKNKTVTDFQNLPVLKLMPIMANMVIVRLNRNKPEMQMIAIATK